MAFAAVVIALPFGLLANTLTFGITSQRIGWDPNETTLTPANVGAVVHGWDSPTFAPVKIGSTTYGARVYGAPLEVDNVTIDAGPYAGQTLSLILAGTTNGDVYAVNAFAQPGVPAGAIVWHDNLGPVQTSGLDAGLPTGIVSTGIVDPVSGRWYVTDRVANVGWEAFAFDLRSGTTIPGWPILLSSNLVAYDTNGNPGWGKDSRHAERGALNLSVDGSLLYVPMGTYGDNTTGWLVAIDTLHAQIASAFSTSNTAAVPGAGLWGSGGPAVSLNGSLYVTTGNANSGDIGQSGVWGESFLAFGQGAALTVLGSYTPWNLPSLEKGDVDLGSGSVMLPPDLTATGTATPHLAVFAGKQGVVYLLDLDQLPGGGVKRNPAPSAALDPSLKPPGALAPLAVFGPYCDFCGDQGDQARMHSTPAYFATGTASYVYVSGTPKASTSSKTTVPPCLVRLRLMTPAAQPAYLAIDAQTTTLLCLSPGSPVVVGQSTPLVWILDSNVTRHGIASRPILRAFDANTMQQLWTSGTALDPGGKFTLPAISHGTAFVATDRIQAFSLPATGSVSRGVKIRRPLQPRHPN